MSEERDNIHLRSDHVLRGLDLLLGQFRDSENLRAYLEPFLQQVQDLEDSVFDLWISRTLDLASDAQLDQLGAIVGERRDGLDDAAYRRFIRVRILSNLAQGDIERILFVVQEMASAIRVRYDLLHPAGYELTYLVEDAVEDGIRRRIDQRVEEITGSGIGVDVVEAVADIFRFGSLPLAEGKPLGTGVFAVHVRTDE